MLDDQFNYVSSSSGSQATASSTYPAGQMNTVAPGGPIVMGRNGYLYVWVSNETQGWDVFFDNLAVQHKQGPVLEENHYYPFGLSMAGISDKALKSNYAQNKYRYNGKELQNQEFGDGTGLEEYDYGKRFYDQQIGRWGVLDPLAEKYYSQSPYDYSLNNPILFNDLDGRDVDPSRLKGKDNVSAAKNLLSTKAGYKLISQFMHKGQSLKITVDGKTTTFTFDKEGARAKDNLVLVSTPNSQMNPDASGDAGAPREGLTREYERDSYDKEIGDDKDYDIKKGVTYLVNLDQSSSEEESTSTLTHELAVHVDPNVQRVQNIENKVVDGTLKPGTDAYVAQLKQVQNSAGQDHANLGQGKNTTYQNISAQLDQLKNTKQYTQLYNEDVKSNKR